MYLFQPKYTLKVNVWITKLSLGTGVCTSWESMLEWFDAWIRDLWFWFNLSMRWKAMCGSRN